MATGATHPWLLFCQLRRKLDFIADDSLHAVLCTLPYVKLFACRSVVEPSTSRLRACFLAVQPAIGFDLSSDAKLSSKDETGNVYWRDGESICCLDATRAYL